MHITTPIELVKYFWNSDQSTILIGTILGIIFRYFYEYTLEYFRAKDKAKIQFDMKGLLLTLLLSFFLSIILFSSIFGKVAELDDDLLIFSISAQNGFFWQTLIGDISKNKSKKV